MEELLLKMYEYLAKYGLNVLAAIVILVVGRIASKLISSGVEKAMVKARVDKTLAGFTRGLCNILLMVVVIIAALTRLGVDTKSFIAILGAAGLAVGFALQGSLSNFAAGIMLITFKPFKVGDFVEIGGKDGTVREIHIFNTMLDSPDNIRIIIPNGQVTGGSILNYTVNGTRRVDLVIGVSYEDDLQKAEIVMKGILADDKRILPEPEAVVAVNELGDSSVNFVVRPWVKSVDYWDVYFDLTAKIKTTLDENGISIPYPQRVVHLNNAGEGS
jgi:small conductance mechanosensitive channel